LSKLQQKWDLRYTDMSYIDIDPTPLLIENSHLIPRVGRALDLACGLGVNALYLASLGLKTSAWDLSPVAIETLQQKALAVGVELNAEVCDLALAPLPVDAFDLIYVGHFLERSLAPQIEMALRPGGLLFYETWVVDKVSDEGPSNPEFLLGENELLDLFPTLKVRYFRDEGRLGDLDQGERNRSMLIAQRGG